MKRTHRHQRHAGRALVGEVTEQEALCDQHAAAPQVPRRPLQVLRELSLSASTKQKSNGPSASMSRRRSMAGPRWMRARPAKPARRKLSLGDARMRRIDLEGVQHTVGRETAQDRHARVAAQRADLHRAPRAPQARQHLEVAAVERGALDARQAEPRAARGRRAGTRPRARRRGPGTGELGSSLPKALFMGSSLLRRAARARPGQPRCGSGPPQNT